MFKKILQPIPLILLLITVIYFLTISPYPTGYTDSDFLAAIGYHGSPAHPPGYPLLTALTYLFTHLIPISTIAFRAKLLALIIQLCNLYLSYLITKQAICKLHSKLKPAPALFSIIFALVITALSLQVWLQATLLEKYSIASLLILLSIYLYFSPPWKKRGWGWLDKITSKFTMGPKDIVQSLILGIAIAYHELAIPTVFTILYLKYRQKTLKIAHLLFAIFAFGCNTILLYIFNLNPTPFGFNFPQTIDGLLSHLFRQTNTTDFYTNQASFHNAIPALYHYIHNLGSSYLWIPLLFAAYGAYKLYQSNRHLAFLSLTAFLTTGPLLAMAVGWPDKNLNELTHYYHQLNLIHRTHLTSHLLLTPFIAIGICSFSPTWIRKGWGWFDGTTSKLLISPHLIFTLFFTFFILIYNFPLIASYHTSSSQHLAQSTLNLLPPNSLLILASDYPTFTLLYQHTINQYRPDLTIIPLNRFLRSQFESQHSNIQTFHFHTNPERIFDLIGTNLSHRSVYLLGLHSSYHQTLTQSGLQLNHISLESMEIPTVSTDYHRFLQTYQSETKLYQATYGNDTDAILQNQLTQQAFLAQTQNKPTIARQLFLQLWLTNPDNLLLVHQIRQLTPNR